MQPISEQHDTKDAAKTIGVEPDTLRNSRHTGRLAGVPGPRYRKIGNRVFYESAALNEWLAQFEERTCTNEAVGRINKSTAYPQRNQQVLVKSYIKEVDALVNDLGSGHLRLGSIQSTDEAIAGGSILLQILRNARVSE